MPNEVAVRTLSVGKARVQIHPTMDSLGNAAASEAAGIINAAVRQNGGARVIVATGNSQLSLIEHLAERGDVPWKYVHIFHMDEYVGIPATHPSSFRYWIKKRLEDRVHPAAVNYIQGDTANVQAEADRYSQLLLSEPIDLAFVGFGENGHIAFNDPHEANFDDPATVKLVHLDEPCRKQQADEGHFESPQAVPSVAITVTCPGLFRANAWVCSVPEKRKAEAVRNAFEGPVATTCPASIIRWHPNATVYLDQDSASLLSADSGQS